MCEGDGAVRVEGDGGAVGGVFLLSVGDGGGGGQGRVEGGAVRGLGGSGGAVSGFSAGFRALGGVGIWGLRRPRGEVGDGRGLMIGNRYLARLGKELKEGEDRMEGRGGGA